MPDGTDKPIPTTLNRMRLAQPAFRRTVEGFQVVPARLSTGRAARFAESILARYAGRCGPASRANLLYQRPEYRWIVKHVLHRSSTNVSLRLALTFTNDHQAIGSQPADDRRRDGSQLTSGPALLPLAMAIPRAPLAGELPAHGQGAPPARALMRLASTPAPPPETPYGRQSMSPLPLAHALAGTGRMALAFQPAMTDQMSRRGQRVPMTRPVGRETAAEPVARPVPRIVHRPQGAPVPQSASEPDAIGRSLQKHNMAGSEFPAAMTQIRSPHGPGWTGASASGAERSLAPHHVLRLADQVVQIIDDRVIARRERVGRI